MRIFPISFSQCIILIYFYVVLTVQGVLRMVCVAERSSRLITERWFTSISRASDWRLLEIAECCCMTWLNAAISKLSSRSRRNASSKRASKLCRVLDFAAYFPAYPVRAFACPASRREYKRTPPQHQTLVFLWGMFAKA